MRRPDEREAGAVALDAERLRDTPEPVHASEGRRAFRKWVGEAWFVGTLVSFRDGGWLVQLWNRPADADATRYALLQVDRHGEPLLEAETDYRLLEADPDRGRVYFWDPGGLQPNRIRIARMRAR